MGAQERLLERVLALVLGAEHVPAEGEQRAVVTVVDDLEGALVAGGGELGETCVVEPSDTEADERGSDRLGCHLVTHLPTPDIGTGWRVVKRSPHADGRRRMFRRRSGG